MFMSQTKTICKKWVCERKEPTPQTKDGCSPAITATYELVSLANMFSTAHFPRMGVIEIGHYEQCEKHL